MFPCQSSICVRSACSMCAYVPLRRALGEGADNRGCEGMYQRPCEGVCERGGERVEEVRREQLVDEAPRRVSHRQCKGVPEGVFDTVGERLVQLISEAVGQACGEEGKEDEQRAKAEKKKNERIRRREEERWIKVHKYENVNVNTRVQINAHCRRLRPTVISVQYPQI